MSRHTPAPNDPAGQAPEPGPQASAAAPMPTPGTTAAGLDPLRLPLRGSQLIEASAGTGKTWTIAALYLRLVLGHGGEQGFARPLRPDEILVMTFTRAATRELSDRIRARLVAAASVFRGDAAPEPGDSLLPALLAAYPEGPPREAAAWQLAQAAEGMDDAAVHTIDAWCQRMLREHAFDSGSLFDEDLVADEGEALLQAAQDYWRQQCYPLDAAALDWALQAWGDVAGLAADARALQGQPLPEGSGQEELGELIERLGTQRQQRLADLRQGWSLRAQLMREWLDEETADKTRGWNGSKLQARFYGAWLERLATWAEDEQATGGPDLTDSARFRLTPDGLRDARKAGTPDRPLPQLFEDFAELMRGLDDLPDPLPSMRAHAALRVGQRLQALKLQAGQLGFADLLQRLDAALAAPGGERLRQRILAQTPVALIDEFQDTSALQYRLFDRLYRVADNDPATALLLIGDPKQSIYRFRGADIHSYLSARQATAGRHHVLGTNHRATAALVSVVNQLFAEAEGQLPGGAFGYRDSAALGDNPLPFVPVAAQGRAEHFQSQQGPVPALSLQFDPQPAGAQDDQRRFATRCADQIVRWLNDAACGFAREGQPLQRLRPADVAVLVRSGREAQAIRLALSRRGVSSVYLSDRDSVLASDEASDLLRWLRAVAEPANLRLLRAAMATRTVGLSLAEMQALAQDDALIDQRIDELRALQQVWRSQGVLALLRRSLHQLALPARWLAEPDGERRLTNVLHLAELLQAQSRQLEGEQALIRWLAEQVAEAADGAASGDEQIVRLESDADLVKVVTVHKSKGLEYPVVCLPFACSHRAASSRNTPFVAWVDEQGQPQLALQPNEDALARAEQDRLREDLRLLYVALTRARHALWLGYGARTHGPAKATVNHLSAAGRLLTGDQPSEPAQQRDALQALAARCPGLALDMAPAPERGGLAPQRLMRREAAPVLLPAPLYPARRQTPWRIASFSALVRGLGAGNDGPLAALPVRPADDESDGSAATEARRAGMALGEPSALAAAGEDSEPGLPASGAGAWVSPADAPGWHRFERGALAGNFLHDQLEWLAGEGFDLSAQPALAAQLRRRCERAGRAEHAELLLDWLSRLCDWPLRGPQVALSGLSQLLPEMEFWLPVDRLPPEALGRWCEQQLLATLPYQGGALAPLSGRVLHGMVMGFADLVFEHEGRFWVLDYKSNHLGNDGAAYTEAALAEAMAQHRYDVQAGLYLLALHRLLRSRLGEQYDPAQHLGGAVYYFIRGIDGPAGGVCLLPAPLPLLAQLDSLLDAPGANTP